MLTPEDTEDHPSCPICLQHFDPLDKAVISSCLHAFCIGCLQAWCRRSVTRLCPLCKGRISGYLYDIKGDDNYQEHVFDQVHGFEQHQQIEWPPPSQAPYTYEQNTSSSQHTSNRGHQGQVQQRVSPDSRQPVQHEPDSHAHLGRRVQLRTQAGYTWGHPAQWREDILRAGSNNNNSTSRSRRSASLGSRQQQELSRRSAATVGQQHNDDGGAAPRPYYWRVQQRMLASVTRLGSSSSSIDHDGSSSTSALEVRRNIYRNSMWSLPHQTAVATTVSGSCTASGATLARAPTAARRNSGNSSNACGVRVSDASLETWMARELQALLMEADVTIVCAYVKGLVNSFGVTVPELPTLQQSQQSAAAAAASDAAEQQQRQVDSMRQAALNTAAALHSQHARPVDDDTAIDGVSSRARRGSSAISSAVAALEAFLFDVAPHFWHELCCYATSGLTVAAWDRTARHVHQPRSVSQQQQQCPQAQAVLSVGSAAVSNTQHMSGTCPNADRQQQQQQQQGPGVYASAAPAALPASAPFGAAAVHIAASNASVPQYQQPVGPDGGIPTAATHTSRKRHSRSSSRSRHRRGRSCSRDSKQNVHSKSDAFKQVKAHPSGRVGMPKQRSSSGHARNSRTKDSGRAHRRSSNMTMQHLRSLHFDSSSSSRAPAAVHAQLDDGGRWEEARNHCFDYVLDSCTDRQQQQQLWQQQRAAVDDGRWQME